MRKCKCWICSPILRSILSKLKGKEKKWYKELIDRCITAEDDVYYLKYIKGKK